MANVKLTKTIVQNVCGILKIDRTIEEACRHAGISKQTHYNWIKQKKFYLDEKPVVHNGKTILKKTKIFYEDAVKKSEDYAKMLASNTWIQAIEKGNLKAAIEFLSKRDPRYKDKLDINTEDDFEFDESELIED